MNPFHNLLECAGLKSSSHQEYGVKWCLNMETDGTRIGDQVVRGGIIADEMGLGKTIQMIGVCLCNIQRRTLIVLPRALLEQWADVLQTTVHHTPIIYHGYQKKNYDIDALQTAPIVLTTYGMIGQRSCILHKVAWNRIIFDEAHHLRNQKTSIFKGSAKLQSPIKWLMTGTPIQNKKKDFYNLCRVIGYPHNYYKEHENIPSIMLRRTKKDVNIIMPAVNIQTISVKWKDKQEEAVSKLIHSQLEFSGIDRAAEMSDYPIVLMVRARQMCVYPPLTNAISNVNSKLASVVDNICARRNNGASKLVFCHFRGEIDALQNMLPKDFSVETFDGRTTQQERIAILTSTCDVLIMQIQTGCEGLNLQQFSEIYFVSTHWNPAVEDQAIARCHRVGQTKPVNVFKFNMSGFAGEDKSQTIDTYACDVQENKREIAKSMY